MTLSKNDAQRMSELLLEHEQLLNQLVRNPSAHERSILNASLDRIEREVDQMCPEGAVSL